MKLLTQLYKLLTNDPLDFPFWWALIWGFIFGLKQGVFVFVILAGMRFLNSLILALDRYRPTEVVNNQFNKPVTLNQNCSNVQESVNSISD